MAAAAQAGESAQSAHRDLDAAQSVKMLALEASIKQLQDKLLAAQRTAELATAANKDLDAAQSGARPAPTRPQQGFVDAGPPQPPRRRPRASGAPTPCAARRAPPVRTFAPEGGGLARAGKVAELEAALKQLQDRVAAAHKAGESAHVAHRELDSSQAAKISGLETSLQQLQHQVEAARAASKDLDATQSSKLATLEAAVRDLDRQIAQQQQEKAERRSQKAGAAAANSAAAGAQGAASAEAVEQLGRELRTEWDRKQTELQRTVGRMRTWACAAAPTLAGLRFVAHVLRVPR